MLVRRVLAGRLATLPRERSGVPRLIKVERRRQKPKKHPLAGEYENETLKSWGGRYNGRAVRSQCVDGNEAAGDDSLQRKQNLLNEKSWPNGQLFVARESSGATKISFS